MWPSSIRSRTAPPHRSATIAGGVSPRASGTSYDATSRRNLAGNAIVIARSLIQRAYSLRSNQVENSTTDTAKALPGIVDGSAYRFGPHVVKHDRGLIRNVGQAFRGKGCV